MCEPNLGFESRLRVEKVLAPHNTVLKGYIYQISKTSVIFQMLFFPK